MWPTISTVGLLISGSRSPSALVSCWALVVVHLVIVLAGCRGSHQDPIRG